MPPKQFCVDYTMSNEEIYSTTDFWHFADSGSRK